MGDIFWASGSSSGFLLFELWKKTKSVVNLGLPFLLKKRIICTSETKRSTICLGKIFYSYSPVEIFFNTYTHTSSFSHFFFQKCAAEDKDSNSSHRKDG